MLETMLQSSEAVYQALLGSAPDGPIAVAATDPRRDYPGAFPVEIDEMARAGEARRREFIAGRVAAHRAMEQLGLNARPVTVARSRAPSWPRGLVGSLSHNATTCIAAVARASQVKSLGVDIAEDTPLDPDTTAAICTLEERAWLAARPEASRGHRARLILSAKKAVCKAQYPLSHRVIDVTSLLVTPDVDTGQFEATFLAATGPFPAHFRLDGRFCVQNGLIHSATLLLPGALPA